MKYQVLVHIKDKHVKWSGDRKKWARLHPSMFSLRYYQEYESKYKCQFYAEESEINFKYWFT